MYPMFYIEDCAIGSAGIIHLSKAKWGMLNYLSLRIFLFIKEKTKLWVKT
jgi:hypothetical protein